MRRRPVGKAHFADVNIAVPVERHTMRRDEFTGHIARAILSTQSRDHRAVFIDNADAWADIGMDAVHARSRAEFADDEFEFRSAMAK